MGGCLCKEKHPIDFDAPVNLDHFKILRSIGKGAFGKVCIVMRRDNERMFAMKYMNKEKCIAQKAVKNVMNEIKILKCIEHPFIVNLQYAFHDPEDIFMVCDLMMGGDLRYHLNRQGCFSEARVQLYVAEIVEALLYIHPLGIVHRDLKPDNMLLDESGHVHLTDWNVAARMVPTKKLGGRAGTTPYMAPEVFVGKGYDYMCDWWSLGICMFEMLKGKLPFKGANQEEVIKGILSSGLTLPTHVTSECRKLMKRFIDRNPKTRLGYVADGPQEVKRHPFFFKIAWDLLIKKQISPPFVPAKDRVNCDAMYELEEMMLEDNPLHKKKQRLQNKAGDSNTELNEALDAINTDFKVFEREKEKLKDRGLPKKASRKLSISKIMSRRRSSTSAAAKGAPSADVDGNPRRHSLGEGQSQAESSHDKSSSEIRPASTLLPDIVEKSASAEMSGRLSEGTSRELAKNDGDSGGGRGGITSSPKGKMKLTLDANLEMNLEGNSKMVSPADSQTLSLSSEKSSSLEKMGSNLKVEFDSMNTNTVKGADEKASSKPIASEDVEVKAKE